MAANNKKKSEEKVILTVPWVDGEESEITIGINGKNWVIMKGEPVEVPRAVAEIYWQSERQKMFVERQRRALASQVISEE